MISPIGKIGVRSSGPAGCPVPGFSGGSGSPGRSGSRLTQWGGISSSPRTYFVGSLMEPILWRAASGGDEAGEPAQERAAAGMHAAGAAVLRQRDPQREGGFDHQD